MSARDLDKARFYVERINHELGEDASFAVVTLCALERLLYEVITAKVAAEETEEPEETKEGGGVAGCYLSGVKCSRHPVPASTPPLTSRRNGMQRGSAPQANLTSRRSHYRDDEGQALHLCDTPNAFTPPGLSGRQPPSVSLIKVQGECSPNKGEFPPFLRHRPRVPAGMRN